VVAGGTVLTCYRSSFAAPDEALLATAREAVRKALTWDLARRARIDFGIAKPFDVSWLPI
jgi:hypothetical protein